MESRTKNARRNMIFGIILKIYQIVVPFFMRTALLYWLGVNYLGLNSLYTSVLSVLNLTELGVGAAMIYSMYKPVSESDENKICALLKLYRQYYRIIGTVIATIGLIITPFIPYLIKGDVPADINVYILYLMNLASTVLSYWLFSYRASVLQAHQRADVISKISLFTNTCQYTIQLFVLWISHNYYLYIVVMLITQVLNNLTTAFIVHKMYPNYKPEGDLSDNEKKSINRKIRDLFTAKFGAVVIGSVDTIVISSFLGLVQLGIYQNYYYIINSVYGIVIVLFNSVLAGIGNSLITEKIEKNYNDFKKLSFITSWLITICVCCFSVMYQPFMRIWVGNDLMLDDSYVYLFCILFYVLALAMAWATVKDAAGLWHHDRFRPLIGAAANLCMNLIFVQVVGLYGIIISTVFSYVFISMPWLIHNLFKYLYKTDSKEYVLKLLFYVFVTVVCCTITVLICKLFVFGDALSLVVYFLIAVIVSCLIQFLFYHKTPEFAESKRLVLKLIRGKGL